MQLFKTTNRHRYTYRLREEAANTDSSSQRAAYPKRIIALAIAPAVLATVLILVPTTVSAQEHSEEDTATEIDSVFSLLSFEDLEYLTPLEPQQRREFLEFELSLLIETHDLTLTADEKSTLIDSWLALLAGHEPQTEDTPDLGWARAGQRSSGGNWQRSSGERPSTDTGYMPCNSSYIDNIGISYQVNGGYDTIHLEPSFWGKWYASSNQIYDAMISCFKRELHMWPHVDNWDSIYQQLVCHALGQYTGQTGPTWDLEGHRRSNTFWIWTVLSHRCNW